MKLLVIGQGRHGKDEACSYLEKKQGLTFESSSKVFVDEFGELLLGLSEFNSVEEFYENRFEYRDLLYQAICAYNKHDKAKLAKKITQKYDIYCGLRDDKELEECVRQNVFDAIIWVDASKRVSYIEPSSSCKVTKEMADFIVDNNGTLEHLYRQLDLIIGEIKNR